MTARDIKEKLRNDIAWVHRITQQTDYSRFWPYDSTDFHLFEEVTARIPTGKQGRFGERLQRRRMDAVAVIRVNSHRYRPVLVGIEVKTSASDLKADKKICDYLPYVDTFYLAVPKKIIDEAFDYASSMCMGRIGVIAVDRCVRIEKQGAFCQPSDKNRGELCQELLMKSLWKEAEQIGVKDD